MAGFNPNEPRDKWGKWTGSDSKFVVVSMDEYNTYSKKDKKAYGEYSDQFRKSIKHSTPRNTALHLGYALGGVALGTAALGLPLGPSIGGLGGYVAGGYAVDRANYKDVERLASKETTIRKKQSAPAKRVSGHIQGKKTWA